MYTIIKKEVEYYKMQLPIKSMYWVNIMLEETNMGGRIIIVSDYGTWTHYWENIGWISFKDFLVILNNINYVAEKFKAIDKNNEPTAKFKKFWEDVWPEFIELIEDELKQVKAGSR